MFLVTTRSSVHAQVHMFGFESYTELTVGMFFLFNRVQQTIQGTTHPFKCPYNWRDGGVGVEFGFGLIIIVDKN